MDLDLDGFDEGSAIVTQPSLGKDTAAEFALRYIDDRWYRDRNRRGRQMDLIGDYAGTEPFILDGNDHHS